MTRPISPESAEIIRLRREEHLSNEAIAERTGRNKSTVNGVLLRAMRRDPSLRMKIEKISPEQAGRMREAIQKIDQLNERMGDSIIWSNYADAIEDAGILGKDQFGQNRRPTKMQISQFCSAESKTGRKERKNRRGKKS